MPNEWIKTLLRKVLPNNLQRVLKQRQRILRPVDWGTLRRTEPVGRNFGLDRGGRPVDRYYIEKFLSRYETDVRGHVLEIGDANYSTQFGGDRIDKVDVLHVEEGNPEASIVANLEWADTIGSASFDCVILTQTLQFIYDMRAALGELHRILKPGGTVLATVPGISQISRYDMDRWGDYWRFTTLSAGRLFGEQFPSSAVTVEAYGNVLAATALLQGIVTEELSAEELDSNDPDYPLVVGVRASKPGRDDPS